MTPILVFDIETVPDIAGIRRVNDIAPAVADADVMAWFAHERRAATGGDFAPLYLQKVVAIGCALREAKRHEDAVRHLAKAAGVDRRVKFLVQDAMTVDVSDATVVTLYLLSASNVKLRPILTRQLGRGARIVSHSFAMGDWEPEVVDTFRDANGTSRTLYLWTTDGKTRP